MNNILGKVNVGVSKLVGTCLISFFRCQSRHNGVTATEAQCRMPTPRRIPRLPRRVLSPRSLPQPPRVANAPLAAAVLMCEPRGTSGRRSRRKSPRTDKALPTRQCSDFNASRAARHMPQPMPLYMPQPPTAAYCTRPPPLAATLCTWLWASVRKFCWAMVSGCTRLIECSGYFFLVQLTLCTLYNLTKNTTVNVPTIQ